MNIINLMMRLIMLLFWAGVIYAVVGPDFQEVGTMPMILGVVVLVMHLLQMLMLKQASQFLDLTAKDYLAVLVFGSFAMNHHRARLKEISEENKQKNAQNRQKKQQSKD
ncbi:hypothetical protein CBP31_06730 [Oceanisphaera profunda]|uniref:DUF1145 domain-containing protein n=1 Tax=Oceanisphaera profunda TaxID=1416627 RepID=A0A1Y0D487_9GAMM|nr:DUF1145 domain-containing protein [Oceanisphaera profunda]ART82351.1 hypothetical protein CBP31_06730 [Oceanisphaera profunda]